MHAVHMVFLFAFRPRASRAAAAADPWLVAGPARTRRHEGECRPPASRSFVNNTLRRFVRVAIVASTRTVVVRGRSVDACFGVQGAQGEPGSKGERGDPGLPVRARAAANASH